MSRSWKSRVGVLALTATMGIGLVGLASPAGAATGGNSANAKTCQNNGWKTTLRADGTAFKNQGDCVSYAAQGGAYALQCYDSTGVYADFRLTAPIDTVNNTMFTNSVDGTCSGGFNPPLRTIVSAIDLAGATAKCQALIGHVPSGSLNSFGYATAPSNWWICDAS